MSLEETIRELADRTLMALDSSHDYYTYTKRVWRLVQRIVKEGRTFTFRNLTTGSTVNDQMLLGKAQFYVTEYLTSFTFQHFVSLFEEFCFDLIGQWLLAYPDSLSKKQVDFGTVLRVRDTNAIMVAVIEKELNDLKYKRVKEWFDYLEGLARLGYPTADEIETLSEMKATRDVLVHNKGIVNATYVSKAGQRARFGVGDRLEVPAQYHRESWETIRKVVRDVSEAAIAKVRQTG